MAVTAALSASEAASCRAISAKVENLRAVLDANRLCDPVNAQSWLAHLTQIKDALGNVGNSMSFLGSLLIKEFLNDEFGVSDFDAGLKPQGASGADVEATAEDGRVIVGELKTTKPYQLGFGAAQRTAMLKDLSRLANSNADIRIMFGTDRDAYDAIRDRRAFSSSAPGVLLVDLVSPRKCILGSD